MIPNPPGGKTDFETIGFVPRMQKEPLRIHQIEPGMPAAKAGLKAGDQILSTDGLALHSVDALLAFLQQGQGRPVHVTAMLTARLSRSPYSPSWRTNPMGTNLRVGLTLNGPPYKIQQLPLPAALKQSVLWTFVIPA